MKLQIFYYTDRIFCAVNGAHVLRGGLAEAADVLDALDLRLASLIGRLMVLCFSRWRTVSLIVSASESLVSPEKGVSLIIDANFQKKMANGKII